MIIGPSGSGKDTLISGAKLLLDNENRYVFAQREITRPQTGDAEHHIEMMDLDHAENYIKVTCFDRLLMDLGFILDYF